MIALLLAAALSTLAPAASPAPAATAKPAVAPKAPEITIAGSTPVTVPFTLDENHIVIEISVDGHPTRALFDTGGSNVLSPEFAKGIGLMPVGNSRAGGAGEGTVTAQRARAHTLTFGTITMHEPSFTVLPLPSAMTHGDEHPLEAIVGAEILRKFATRVDYANGTLTFTPSQLFAYRGDGVAIPIQFGGSTPRVQGSIDGIPGLLQIDTGSAASFTITSPFVEAHDLRQKYHAAGNVVMGRGVGGYTHGDIARAKTVFLGPVEVDDPVVELSTDRRGAFASSRYAANVGTDVLRRFTLTFDYAGRTMYVEPTGAAPPPYNRTGMYAQNDDRSFFDVVSVLPSGPAADAGMQSGDRITAIDGKPAAALTANAFWMLMRGPVGDKHVLTVERDGSIQTLTLTLREVV